MTDISKYADKIVWTRILSAFGDYCDGYQAKSIEGLRVMRHHVDDQAYDGGYVATYWNLYVNDAPVDQFATLAMAKSEANRLMSQVHSTSLHLSPRAGATGLHSQ